MTARTPGKVRIALSAPADRPSIYHLRHEVYATELGQHAAQPNGMLTDVLDENNIYIVASRSGELAGFISITPPQSGQYSVEKYIGRNELPIRLDSRTYEVRLLTVSPAHRRSRVAWYLMYAALRWIDEHGGEQIIAMGRTEVLAMYKSFGAELLGRTIVSGAVTFELIKYSISKLRGLAAQRQVMIELFGDQVDWEMRLPYLKPASCFHGGAFFEDIGPEFHTLDRRKDIVNADVLDAWFPPSPRVLATFDEHLTWLIRTSPPTQCEGLCKAVASHRGLRPENILPGAGSSDLIYRTFRHWLHRESRVLILDPSYGEYQHVLERVIGCHVERFTLSRNDGYEVNLDEFASRIENGYDLIVIVNPNNPTGRHVRRAKLESALSKVPSNTRVWIDEAYIDYVGANESLEHFAAKSESVVVCKSMSKAYALSGMRVGYLCASPHQISDLIPLTPPWIVGLPAQVAAVRAIEDAGYYEDQYRRTRLLRAELSEALYKIGIREIVPGEANFLMFHLDESQPVAPRIIEIARKEGIFMRDISSMGRTLGSHAIRIAVKDQADNNRLVQTLEHILLRN